MRIFGFKLAILLLLSVYLSCPHLLGYGIVLWSTDEVLITTGTVLRVHNKSVRRDVYRLSHNGKYFDQPVGRIKLFSSRKKALEYAENFSPYLKNFVEVKQKRNLPVRAKPDPNSEEIYNLPINMRAKVLHRSQTRIEIPPYKGYWYKILTKDGTEGYVYGRYLREFLLTDSGETVYEDQEYFGDAVFESLFEEGITWRPLYYKTMIDSGHIVPELFHTKHGLFLDPKKKYLSIMTPETPNASYHYDRVLPIGHSRYFFYDVGISLHISDELATIFFPYENKTHRYDFVSLNTDLSKYTDAEQERRLNEYQKFLKLNDKLESPWGIIEFTENFQFNMGLSDLAYNRGYISPLDGYSGEVSFNIFLGGKMSQQFDGGLTLTFDKSKKKLPLLYSFTPHGIQFTIIHNVPSGHVIQDEFAAGGLGEHIEYQYTS